MLIWSRGEEDVCASVQATDGVRDPCGTFLVEILLSENLLVRLNRGLSMWPPYLRLEIVATGMRTLDIQAWLLEHKAPVARIRCAPDSMDNHEFGELVASLRERKSVRRSSGPHRVCPSRIGRSRLCDGRAQKKARPSAAALFWRRFMGLCSVQYSSTLTYLSSRWRHKLSRTRNVFYWDFNLH